MLREKENSVEAPPHCVLARRGEKRKNFRPKLVFFFFSEAEDLFLACPSLTSRLWRVEIIFPWKPERKNCLTDSTAVDCKAGEVMHHLLLLRLI